VADDPLREEPELEAGDFSAWLTEMQAAIGGEGESAVPCDGCTACCTSSQFVHIGPDEGDTLAHIPAQLLFPAPGLPEGHVVLGYDQRGHCPMLIDNQCSIYDHRPRTCRTYDCRVYPATGIELRGSRTSLIARRTRRWRFSFPSQSDAAEYEAIRSAATFLVEHRDRLPDPDRPVTETQLAVLAIEVCHLFLSPSTGADDAHPVTPTPEAVYDEVKFHTGRRRSL
jgi:Fe-S-cluster containining protein